MDAFRTFLVKIYYNPYRVSFFGRFKKTNKNEAVPAIEQEQAGTLESIVEEEFEAKLPEPMKKHFSPPANVEQSVLSLAKLAFEEVTVDTELTDNLLKYKILRSCIEEFEFDIPSYELSELNTISDLIKYYSISRDPITPEEKIMSAGDLPKNLHLQFEPVRFTEETKGYFGGKTAFPERDTIVTSLKYRDIYKGFKNPPSYKKKKGFDYV